MSVYHCSICLTRFDEEQEGQIFDSIPDSWHCPLCMAPKSAFVRERSSTPAPVEEKVMDLSYPSELVIEDGGKMDYIHEVAVSGKSPGEAMDTLMPVKAFDDILVLGAQLARFPKDDSFKPDMTTVIGRNAKRPMVLDTPIYVSHMSFGALSKEAKVALAKGSAKAGAAMCSGEGGVLPEEMAASYRYIFEYIPNRYSLTDETFSGCDAVEIKVGQGT